MQTDAVSQMIQEVAEAIIRPRWRALETEQVVEKNPGDLVTVADREAEIELTRLLLLDDPNALVVGEEATFADKSLPDALPTAEHAWTVDPVDGTRNFVDGSPLYAVMVAELRRGETVRSWIWQPELDHMWVAEQGAGVTVDGNLVAPVERTRPYHGSASRRQYLGWTGPGVEPVAPTAWCCGVDYPKILAGESDFVVYYNANPWDHLPGALMLDEIGGTTRLRTGEVYRAGLTGPHLIAAATPDVAEAVTPMWGDGLRD